MMESPYIQYLPDGTSFPMVWVEGGRFWMGDDGFGDEKPVHEVELDSFYIGQYPVTQSLWKAVIGTANNPSHIRGDQRPVESVSWDQIVGDFLPCINGILKKTHIQDYLFRLPTEAEWEFAAKGGKKSHGFSYAGSDQIKNVGWFGENSHHETKDVGLKQPNELGIFDMSGNIWEWCGDWYNGEYYEKCKKQGVVKNPKGPEKGTSRVYRGGSWFSSPESCRITRRSGWRPSLLYPHLGFRLVLSPHSTG